MNELSDRQSRTDAAMLGRYLLLCYALGCANTASFLRVADWSTPASVSFNVLAFPTYTGAYLAPAIALVALLQLAVAWLSRGGPRRRAVARVGAILVAITAVLGAAAIQVLVYADRTIFGMFGMHLNGFVWNLITTPGGLESMGAGTGATVVYALYGGGYVCAHLLLWWLARRPAAARLGARVFRPRRVVALGVVFALAMFAAHIVYGIAVLKMKRSVLVSSRAIPLFKRASIKSVAAWFGVKEAPRQEIEIDDSVSALAYPKAPLVVEPPARPLNLVWLTAESLRADMLDPEIMPRTWALAERAHRFRRHYSGGNGTRMGVFSQFYGLHGSYWFSFLGERKGPVLIDVLLQQRYEFELYTSARFSYPEFDKTVFSRVGREHLHERADDIGWKSDRINVDKSLTWLAGRDRTRPFLMFHFFESPHAQYYFPEESVIRRPYLEDFNYATADIARDIALIKNRYLNACHHLDSQVGRLIDGLQAAGLLDTTIVIVTGDHGEEFMEKGFWGHNSHFSEEQIRVPFVLWVPGSGASVVERLTSHVDVPATILPFLGVNNAPEDYSLGTSMLAPTGRDFAVVASWSEVAYVDSAYKMTFHLGAGNWAGEATDGDDKPIPDTSVFLAARKLELGQLFRELVRFRAGK